MYKALIFIGVACMFALLQTANGQNCQSENINQSLYIQHVKIGSSVDYDAVNETGDQLFYASPGQEYDVEIDFSTTIRSPQLNWGIWIDLNGNGSFGDPGEHLSLLSRRSSQSLTGTISLPQLSAFSFRDTSHLIVAIDDRSLSDPCSAKSKLVFSFIRTDHFNIEIIDEGMAFLPQSNCTEISPCGASLP